MLACYHTCIFLFINILGILRLQLKYEKFWEKLHVYPSNHLAGTHMLPNTGNKEVQSKCV